MSARLQSTRAAIAIAAFVSGAAVAADQGVTAVRATAIGQTAQSATPTGRTALAETDALMARAWGLSHDEMVRASALLRGPRASFSVQNLSPIEALGIHARTPAERRKYAEMFARAHHDDVEQVLAWQQAFTDAMQRLYPNEPVVSFASTGDKPEVDPAIAAAAKVPMSAIKPAPGRHPASGQTARSQQQPTGAR